MKTTSLSVLLLLTLTALVHADVYVCNFSATVTSRRSVAEGTGSLKSKFHRDDLLASVANTAGRSLDPATLQLVYDDQAAQFQVVRKSDGALITIVYSVVDVKQHSVRDASVVQSLDAIRQGSLLEPGATEPVGAIGGEIFSAYTSSVGPVGIFWKARFTVLSPKGGVYPQRYDLGYDDTYIYLTRPTLVQGTFNVAGVRFVPGKN